MDEVQSLREELTRMRTRLRAVAVVGLLVAAGLAVALLRPQPVDEVVVRRVTLVDAEGNPRGQWAVDGLGASELSLWDVAGNPRLVLSAADEQASAVLLHPTGRRSAQLSTVDGVASLHLTEGVHAGTLRVGDGAAVLTVADLGNAQVAEVAAGEQGAILTLSNTPEGGPLRTVVLSGGPTAPEQGPALVLATRGEAGDPEVILQGTGNARAVADGEGPLWEQ